MRLFDEPVSAPKAYLLGTHRCVPPAETLRRFSPHMRTLGITRLADVTGLDAIGLPVHVAIRPTSRALSTAQGKGLDHDSAKASALMESIESWHAEHTELALVHDSHRALARRHPTADPGALPANAGAAPRRDVPYLWARGWDVLNATWTYVPFELVTSNFVFPPGYRPTFSVTSNGLASGNHALEAVTHAICEVIERDAHTLWSLRAAGDQRASAIDLATVDDAACREVLARLERAGVSVRAWDITSDIEVPAYACQIFEPPGRTRWRTLGPAAGFGCHLSPAVALLRALTEAVQSRLTMISGSRDDLLGRAYDQLGDRDGNRRAWEALSRIDGVVRFSSRAAIDQPTFEGDVEALSARLRRAGITSAIAVDLSRADLGVPVVKVVIPGLEGHSAGIAYRPGARAAAAAGLRGSPA
jgi:YcaO-like protein with predicted kinase domain